MNSDDFKRKHMKSAEKGNDDAVQAAALEASQHLLDTIVQPALARCSQMFTEMGVQNDIGGNERIINPAYNTSDANINILANQDAVASLRFKLPPKADLAYWDGLTPIVFVRRGSVLKMFVFNTPVTSENYVECFTVDETTTVDELQAFITTVADWLFEYKSVRTQLMLEAMHKQS